MKEPLQCYRHCKQCPRCKSSTSARNHRLTDAQSSPKWPGPKCLHRMTKNMVSMQESPAEGHQPEVDLYSSAPSDSIGLCSPAPVKHLLTPARPHPLGNTCWATTAGPHLLGHACWAIPAKKHLLGATCWATPARPHLLGHTC